jgi:hypothetical protein
MAGERIDYRDLSVAYGKLLKAVRVATGLGADGFADFLGWDRRHYADQESGQWGCTLHALIEVAWRVRVTPETLISAILNFLPRADRAGTFTIDQCQLFQLAWVDKDGRVHDAADVTYETINAACEHLSFRNMLRKAEGYAPLTRLSAYVLIGHLLVSERQGPDALATSAERPEDFPPRAAEACANQVLKVI